MKQQETSLPTREQASAMKSHDDIQLLPPDIQEFINEYKNADPDTLFFIREAVSLVSDGVPVKQAVNTAIERLEEQGGKLNKPDTPW